MESDDRFQLLIFVNDLITDNKKSALRFTFNRNGIRIM